MRTSRLGQSVDMDNTEKSCPIPSPVPGKELSRGQVYILSGDISVTISTNVCEAVEKSGDRAQNGCSQSPGSCRMSDPEQVKASESCIKGRDKIQIRPQRMLGIHESKRMRG